MRWPWSGGATASEVADVLNVAWVLNPSAKAAEEDADEFANNAHLPE